ncbi:MAG: membrane associated rhomboid family serine protease [Saprospiraceae bacterium]|jgi:membrane associated rhomboid family serine protease|tara:strand:+ start:445 stop:1068 length:624 start_codon:yes stop_codon:yes gene_type:complete
MTVTILIIIVTCLISYKGFKDRSFFEQLKHHPVSEANNGEWYRMVTSGFLHADWFHLGINMYVLYAFGSTVENEYLFKYGEIAGRGIYLAVYIVMIILADIPSFIKHKNNRYYGAIGASGAVSGILFICILYSPWAPLYLYGILEIPSIIFGVLYLVYSSYASKKANDNIGHDAHFYGALAGMVLTAILIPKTLGVFLDQFINGLPF